jgi:hypothetical protein
MRRISVLLAAVAILLSGCARTRAEADRDSRAASALFADFESVLYEEPALLSSSGAYNHLSGQETGNLRFPFVYLKGALDTVDSRTYADVLANSEAVLVGAKDFRPPSGLGAVRSQRCYVAILKSRSGFDFRRYFHEPAANSADGMPIWSWTAKLSEFGENDTKSSSIYAAQVGQSYALVSNDLKELQTLAARLSSHDGDSQPLTGVREWSSVSRHEVWGYRRYRHTGVVDQMAAGMTDVRPGAEALAFFLDSREKAIVLRLFLNPPADERTVALINSRATLPPLKPSGGGVWETTIPLAGNEESSERTFIVVGLFGFPVYL